jgi:hypothetical protein
VRLCLGVGSLRPDGADCALPPLEPLESRLVRRSTATQTVVAGVVPAAVAAVRVRMTGATAPAAPTAPTAPTLPGYAGRYAGSVRFFSLTLPGRRRVVGADLLDAGGRVLARYPGPDFPERPPAVALARQDGIALSATRFLGEPCIEVDGGPCLTPVAGGLDVAAPCVPRRLVLVAALPARTRGLDARLAGGRTIRARVIRLPARAGLRGRVAVAVLPGAAVPARAIVRRARSAPPAARTLVLPAANRQCGYLGTTTLPGVG